VAALSLPLSLSLHLSPHLALSLHLHLVLLMYLQVCYLVHALLLHRQHLYLRTRSLTTDQISLREVQVHLRQGVHLT